MGSFSIKEDNFKNGNDNKYTSGNFINWLHKLNRPVYYIFAALVVIVTVNIIIFLCFFHKSEV